MDASRPTRSSRSVYFSLLCRTLPSAPGLIISGPHVLNASGECWHSLRKPWNYCSRSKTDSVVTICAIQLNLDQSLLDTRADRIVVCLNPGRLAGSRGHSNKRSSARSCAAAFHTRRSRYGANPAYTVNHDNVLNVEDIVHCRH